MRAFFLTSFAVIGLAGCSANGAAGVDPVGPVVTMVDLELIEGDTWTGTLTYLDYGSDKRVTIDAAATVKSVSETKLKYSISYPKEPWEDAKADLQLSQAGRVLDGHVVTSRETREDGRLEIQTSHEGEDNGQLAEIRMTYVLGASNFAIEKDVRFDEASDYVNRNIYSFTRP